MHEVLPGLWLGNFEDARRFSTSVEAVFNCTVDLPFFGGRSNYRVPVDDDAVANDTLAPYLPSAVETIVALLRKNQRVLVHCMAGMQRSPAVVAAVVMLERGADVDGAIEFVRSRRPEAFAGGVNFRPSLDLWSRALRVKPT